MVPFPGPHSPLDSQAENKQHKIFFLIYVYISKMTMQNLLTVDIYWANLRLSPF